MIDVPQIIYFQMIKRFLILKFRLYRAKRSLMQDFLHDREAASVVML
jgi:hypothetical protein